MANNKGFVHKISFDEVKILSNKYLRYTKNRESKLYELITKFHADIYPYVLECVGIIDEPLLVRDIVINNSLYWPGIEYVNENCCSNAGLFWKAYELMRDTPENKVKKVTLKKIYKRFEKHFIDRTLDCLAGIIYKNALLDPKFEKSIENDLSKFYPTFQNRISAKIKECKECNFIRLFIY